MLIRINLTIDTIAIFQAKTVATASTTKVATSENATPTKASPVKATTNAAQQAQTPQQVQVVQAVQRVKGAAVTLAPATPTNQATKNAIVVASPGQTAQVMNVSQLQKKKFSYVYTCVLYCRLHVTDDIHWRTGDKR